MSWYEKYISEDQTLKKGDFVLSGCKVIEVMVNPNKKLSEKVCKHGGMIKIDYKRYLKEND